MRKYDKLIRDKILERISLEGRNFSYSFGVDDEVFRKYLFKKLHEETGEYLAAKTDSEALEELADILEVLSAMNGLVDWSDPKLQAVRARKAEENGTFEKRIILRKA